MFSSPENAIGVLALSLASGRSIERPVGVVGRIEAELLLQRLGLGAELIEDHALHDGWMDDLVPFLL